MVLGSHLGVGLSAMTVAVEYLSLPVAYSVKLQAFAKQKLVFITNFLGIEPNLMTIPGRAGRTAKTPMATRFIGPCRQVCKNDLTNCYKKSCMPGAL